MLDGAVNVPRGLVEFVSSATSPLPFNPIFTNKSDKFVLYCGTGGRAALAGRALMDLGFTDVQNLGGFSGWKEEGGPSITAIPKS
jgi:rhodanese-related sulfurtransferase